MSSLFKGPKQPKFVEPKAVEPPAPAVQPVAAPVNEVDTGGAGADTSAEELRRRYRPSRTGIGTTGTGLSV